MIPLSPLSGLAAVPYRHTVSAVTPIEAATLNLKGPVNPYAKADRSKNADQADKGRGRYDANSAGPGFAAQVLVEAGLAGRDPFASVRGAKAYGSPRAPASTLRLVA